MPGTAIETSAACAVEHLSIRDEKAVFEAALSMRRSVRASPTSITPCGRAVRGDGRRPRSRRGRHHEIRGRAGRDR
jgi:hypothetical protein